MKQITTLILVFLCSTSGISAQINLNKVKEKAPKVNTDVNVPSTGSSGSKNEPAKALESPAKDEIFDFHSDILSGEDALKKYNYPSTKEYIDKLEKLLATINSKDPNWKDPKQDIPRFNKLKEDYERINGEFEMSQRLEDMRSWSNSIKESYLKAYDEWYTTRLNKKNFEEIKAYYTAHSDMSDERAKNGMANMENFYTNELPKIKNLVMGDAKKYLSYTKYIKENRAKPGYLEGLGYAGLDPKRDLNDITEGVKRFGNAVLLFSDDAEFKSVHTTLTERKADLEQYIASPEYTADIARRKQLDIDSILIGTPGMTDPSLDAVVKRDFDTKTWGAIQRISLLDKGWTITKNSAGIPLEKFIDVEVGTSEAKGCWRVSGALVCTYEGGGVYGKPKFIHQSSQEMNCANMKKNGTK